MVLTAVALATVALTAPAFASFPGENGKLAITLEACDGEARYIGAYTPDGVQAAPLTTPCELADEEWMEYRWTAPLDWFPDGQRLLFFEDAPRYMLLATMASDGSDQAPVLPGIVDSRTRNPIPWYGASVAPDGQHFTFEYGRSIWISTLSPTEPRRLRASHDCGRRRHNCVALGGPRWSPDGRTIAVEAHQDSFGPGRPPPLAEGIWLLDATTGKLIRRVAKDGYDIDWAPDGRRLVYRTTYGDGRRETSGGDIYTVRVDGTHRRRLVRRARSAETEPAWSPDGRWIAWVSLRIGRRLRTSLWRVPAEGGRPQMLTRLPSPDYDDGLFTSPTLTWQPLPPAPAG